MSSSAEYTLVYDEAPKSLNAGGTGSRRHWAAGAAEKRRWEGIWFVLLLEQRVPRGMTFATINVLIEFAERRRRDAENYRSAVSKPFADCLVKGGWLADDTADEFEFFRLTIIGGSDEIPCKARTIITLDAEYA